MPSDLLSLKILSSWGSLLPVVGILAAVFILGWIAGKNRLMALLISVYFSYIITKAVPWKKLPFLAVKNNNSLPTYEIFLFLGLILTLFFLLPRSDFGHSLRLHRRKESGWYEVLLLSFSAVTLLLYLLLSFFPSKLLADLPLLVKKYFVGGEMGFFWLAIPIVVLVLLRRRGDE